MSLTVTMHTFSPSKAQALLDISQGHNVRKVTEGVVERFADIMAKGGWDENGESIILDRAGKLLDGYHRLHAIVRSGVTLRMPLVRGADNALNIDTGRRRSFQQVLAARGEKHSNILASGLGALWNYQHGVDPLPMSLKAKRASYGELLALLGRTGKNMRLAARKLTRLQHPYRTMIPQGLHCLLVYLLVQHMDEETADLWISEVGTGAGLTTSSPVRRLRERLLIPKSVSQHLTLTTKLRCAFAIKAFNAWILDEEMGRLSFVTKGKSQEAFPKILIEEVVSQGV